MGGDVDHPHGYLHHRGGRLGMCLVDVTTMGVGDGYDMYMDSGRW